MLRGGAEKTPPCGRCVCLHMHIDHRASGNVLIRAGRMHAPVMSKARHPGAHGRCARLCGGVEVCVFLLPMYTLASLGRNESA